MILWTVIVHIAAIVASIFIGIYLYRSIARPIAALALATTRVSAGDLDTAISVDADDELGKLARRFNEMTKSLREHQARLIQTEKLAGLGRMAAGIAHEINNPLGVILGYVKLLRRRDGGQADKELATIEDEAEQCREVVEGLLDLTRPQAVDAAPVDLGALAKDVVDRLAMSKACPAVSTLSTNPECPEIAAPIASMPSDGMYESMLPKWNSVGHETWVIMPSIDGTPEP